MDTLAQARATIEAQLLQAGVPSAAADSVWLLEAVTGLSPSEQRLAQQRPLHHDEVAQLQAYVSRRCQREPLQRILGHAPFFGLMLEVPPGVLIPRPETESLVVLGLEAIAHMAAPRVLDVGCGSGAVALAIAHERPDAHVSASDINPTAVWVTRANALRLGVRVQVLQSDLLQSPEVAALATAADVLIANLPYLPVTDAPSIPPEVAFDPPEALFAGADGLDVARALARQAAGLMQPGARVLFELDPRNVQLLADELKPQPAWTQVEVRDDLTGRARFLLLTRAETR